MAREITANKKSKSFEETLWDSANKLRGSVAGNVAFRDEPAQRQPTIFMGE